MRIQWVLLNYVYYTGNTRLVIIFQWPQHWTKGFLTGPWDYSSCSALLVTWLKFECLAAIPHLQLKVASTHPLLSSFPHLLFWIPVFCEPCWPSMLQLHIAAQGLLATSELQHTKKPLTCSMVRSPRAKSFWSCLLPFRPKCRAVKKAEIGRNTYLEGVEGEAIPYLEKPKAQAYEGYLEWGLVAMGPWLTTSAIWLMM